MDVNRYNAEIRKAISAKYVECGKREAEIDWDTQELQSRLTRFMDGLDIISYQDYIDIRSSIDRLHHEKHVLSIQKIVWNEARELCLNIADQVDEG